MTFFSLLCALLLEQLHPLPAGNQAWRMQHRLGNWALDNLEAICAVDGIDALFIGPADLTAWMGHGANQAHPDVQAAVERTIARIIAAGKPVGTLCGDVDTARKYFSWGCSFVAVGNDVKLLANATRSLSSAARALV